MKAHGQRELLMNEARSQVGLGAWVAAEMR
jgi:hypothetical protein